jgi:hypothetical protein
MSIAPHPLAVFRAAANCTQAQFGAWTGTGTVLVSGLECRNGRLPGPRTLDRLAREHPALSRSDWQALLHGTMTTADAARLGELCGPQIGQRQRKPKRG